MGMKQLLNIGVITGQQGIEKDKGAAKKEPNRYKRKKGKQENKGRGNKRGKKYIKQERIKVRKITRTSIKWKLHNSIRILAFWIKCQGSWTSTKPASDP